MLTLGGDLQAATSVAGMKVVNIRFWVANKEMFIRRNMEANVDKTSSTSEGE